MAARSSTAMAPDRHRAPPPPPPPAPHAPSPRSQPARSRPAKSQSPKSQPSPQGQPARGVVVGKSINVVPPPPAGDVLGNPLVVLDLPGHKRPKEDWRSRLRRWLAKRNLISLSRETLLHWTVHDAIASVMASVSLAATLEPGRRIVTGAASPATIVTVRHPYHLRQAFDLLLQLPDSMGPERRFLELLLNRILRRYGEQMSAMKGSPFAFEHEAREYFHLGGKIERQLAKISAPEERLLALQAVHDAYFHGRNYYYFALLRRERLKPDSTLHLQSARATYFMARLTWDGSLADKAQPHLLPSRAAVRFLLQRDKSVLTRFGEDEKFRAQCKALIDSFPERDVF